MFDGFTPQAEEFLIALRFNNNTDFFHENHSWYEQSVRKPLKALAEALSPAVELFDPRLERRPARVMSHINRDMRYSHDRGPYHDSMWLGFRHSRQDRDALPGLYFEISPEGAHYGMGIYLENRPMLNGLRRELRENPEPFCALYADIKAEFPLAGTWFKRLSIPDGLPDDARLWYPLRTFWLEKTVPYDTVHSPALVAEIERGYNRLKPIYDYLTELEPCDTLE